MITWRELSKTLMHFLLYKWLYRQSEYIFLLGYKILMRYFRNSVASWYQFSQVDDFRCILGMLQVSHIFIASVLHRLDFQIDFYSLSGEIKRSINLLSSLGW